MNRAIEFHDSVISGVTETEGSLTVTLDPAIVHESDGVPGIAPGRTYARPMTLHFADADWTNTLPPTQRGELYSATIRVGDRTFDNSLPLPFEAKGVISADFRFGYLDAAMKVRANALRCVVSGSGRHLDDFPGAV